VPPGVSGHREKVGRLDVFEYRRRSKVAPYGLRMESQVSTREEAESSHSEALGLTSDLNAIWAYVAGVPLFPKRLVIALASPTGWRTNFEKLEATLPTTARLGRKIRITHGPMRVILPYMPLQRALAAVVRVSSTSALCRRMSAMNRCPSAGLSASMPRNT